MTEKHTFYVPTTGFQGSRVDFPAEEARHAARVLRIAPGNRVQVVDGDGRRCLVHIDESSRSRMTGHVERELDGEPQIRPAVTLAVALLKHGGRFETILEKATELGVARIVPLVTERTESRRLRMDRSQAILVSAMKQSGRARMPELHDTLKLDKAWSLLESDLVLACHEAAGPDRAILEALQQAAPFDSATILVGPEGGFSGDEIRHITARGGRTVSLGPTRLRTETAAVAALSVTLLASFQ